MIRYRKLSPTGDYVFGRGQSAFLIDSPDAVAQAIQTRLGLYQGEWFLDAAAGTPWFQQILGRHANVSPRNAQPLYDIALKTVILNTLGVTGLISYFSALDSSARALTVSASVQTLFSVEPISISQFVSLAPPFVIGSSPLG